MFNHFLNSTLYNSDRYRQGAQNYNHGNMIINQAVFEESNARYHFDNERFRVIAALDQLTKTKQRVFYNTLAPFLNSYSTRTNLTFISLDYSENIPRNILNPVTLISPAATVYYQDPNVILRQLAEHGYSIAIALSQKDIDFVHKYGLCGTFRPIRELHGIALSNAIYAFWGNGTKENGGLGIEGGQRILQERFSGYFIEFTLDSYYQISQKHLSDAIVFAKNSLRNSRLLYGQCDYYRNVAEIANAFTNRILFLENQIRSIFCNEYSFDFLNNLSLKMQNALKLLCIVNMPILDLNGNIKADLSLLEDSNGNVFCASPYSSINYNNYASTSLF